LAIFNITFALALSVESESILNFFPSERTRSESESEGKGANVKETEEKKTREFNVPERFARLGPYATTIYSTVLQLAFPSLDRL
jgi:hypothetical protein